MTTEARKEYQRKWVADKRAKEREERAWQTQKITRNGEGECISFVQVPERKTYDMPDGFDIDRMTVMVDAEGKIEKRWDKLKADGTARWDALQETLEAFREDGPRWPEQDVRAAFSPRPEDKLVVYPVGDQHLGMLSWWRETGESYDLDIGEAMLAAAVDHLVERSDEAQHALVVTIGDFLHYDSMKAVTPEHGHILDQDSRAHKMVRAAARALIRTIDRAAEKHEFVTAIIEPGNHDPYSTIWLQELLRIRYENNPRITIDTTPGSYHYFRFGKNLIGTHHGDLIKNVKDLARVMADDRPQDWGQTTHRVWFTGHRHHREVVTVGSVQIETLAILPPPDAYGHGLGFHKEDRTMQAITFDAEDGEIARYTYRPSMKR